MEEGQAPVLLLNANSGYGKSVLLGQWAEHDSRPFASITLCEQHNDPAVLLASIVEALDHVEPVGSEVTEALAGPQPNIGGVALPRLERVLRDREIPLVLVLDELERVESPQSLQAVATIATHFVRGSQLALATRTEPALQIGRLRAHRGLTELGRADLAMTKAESAALLSGLGLQMTPKQLDVLVQRTEGWPVALYLAGLALGHEPDLGKAISGFAGDDRIVVDYIREEFLDRVSRRRLEFLRRISLLDRFNGSLCNAVVGRSGSATELRDISRSNMLLMPIDRRDEWFRFHSLFAEMLRAELRAAEGDMELTLQRRASKWWAQNGDVDRAIDHAIEGREVARAGELVFAVVAEYLSRGRRATIMAWLDLLGEDALASTAELSLTAAFAWTTNGAGAQAEHWASVSRRLLDDAASSPATDALNGALALVEAALGRKGLEAMSDHATVAAQEFPDDSPWLSMCCLINGAGLHLRGFREQARATLSEGARRGAVGAPNIQVLCLSQLALLAIEEGDWHGAETLASQSRDQVDRSGLGDYPVMALALAVSALVRSNRGMAEKAAADLRLGMRLLEALDEFAPWYEAESRIVLARAAARLDDVQSATRMLADAERLLRLTPDANVLGEWIEQTAATIEALSTSGARDLSPAELRVLQLMPTHLSLREIAEQSFLSPNTVKSQAQSVYRKLGVSSRGEAVAQARAAGLLSDGVRPQSPSGR